MFFTSNDDLHERTAKCFLRDDQLFLKGNELKADLAKLDEHYCRLPEDVKQRGIMSFAHRPPHDGFLITQLWDRFMAPDWRSHKTTPSNSIKDAELVKHVNRFAATARKQESAPYFSAEDGDSMLIEKSIPVRMGKWRLVPPEVERN
jgi:hypothetical protein